MHAAADSGCNENAQLMCERSNHGLCRLQRKSWHCGYTRVMAVLLGLMRCWRSSANHTFRFVHRSGGISGNCQREISHNRTSGQSSEADSPTAVVLGYLRHGDFHDIYLLRPPYEPASIVITAAPNTIRSESTFLVIPSANAINAIPKVK